MDGAPPIFVTMEQGSINAQRYRNEILDKVACHLKKMCRVSPTVYFMNDGATAHTGAYEYLRKKGVRCLPSPIKWPSSSCDLNPIEQVWEHLDQAIWEKAPFSSEDLKRFVDEWLVQNKDSPMFSNLCRSFFTRCEDVIAANGETVKPRSSKKVAA